MKILFPRKWFSTKIGISYLPILGIVFKQYLCEVKSKILWTVTSKLSGRPLAFYYIMFLLLKIAKIGPFIVVHETVIPNGRGNLFSGIHRLDRKLACDLLNIVVFDCI